jgi:multidrug efflux system membrane fusion protein
MNIKATISRNPWILAVLVFLLVAIWMISGLGVQHTPQTDTSQVRGPGEVDAVRKVQVETMHAEPIERFITVNGRTAPARTVTISAETEGRVEKIGALRGVPVATGQPILELDMRDRQAKVAQASASVQEHQTAFEAQSRLKKEGYVSDTQLAETLAKLETARAEQTRAQLDLSNRVIRAPFSGVLQEREVEIGDFVRSGDVVATFVDNQTLVVTGTLAEQEIKGIKAGDTARANLVTGQSVNGRIRYLSPVGDEATRTFRIELEIDNRNGDMPAGVTAEMVLKGGATLAQKISPALLTLDTGGALGIYVVDELQRADFVPVNIVRTDTDGIWVAGLPETARVITVGQGYVTPGQQVESSNPPSESAIAAETPR